MAESLWPRFESLSTETTLDTKPEPLQDTWQSLESGLISRLEF